MIRLFLADVEHDPPVSEFEGDGFAGVYESLWEQRAGMPGGAMIVTVNRGDGRRAVLVLGRHPDGDEQPTAGELAGMSRPGRHDVSAVLALRLAVDRAVPKGVDGFGDIVGR